jgi:hypothetical protein
MLVVHFGEIESSLTLYDGKTWKVGAMKETKGQIERQQDVELNEIGQEGVDFILLN